MAQGAPAAFFSYCREDSDFAIRLAGDLKAAGASVWLDQLDIIPGQRWDRAVEDALTNCPRMLVILSPASVSSTNVMDEVSFALEEQKTVIPVIHRDCTVPFRLRRVQHVDFRQDYARGLQELLKTLALGQEAGQSKSAIPDVGSQSNVLDVDERKRAADQARLEDERRKAAEQAERTKPEREQPEGTTQTKLRTPQPTDRPNYRGSHYKFAELIGVGIDSMQWSKSLVFTISCVASSSIYWTYLILIGVLPRWQSFLHPFIFVAVTIAAFRFIRNAVAAAALAAVTYAVLLTLLYNIHSRAYSLVWCFLFLCGLSYSTRYIRPLWLALWLPTLATPLVDTGEEVIRQVLLRVATIDKVQLLKILAVDLTRGIVFSLFLWKGLSLAGKRNLPNAAVRNSPGM